MLHRPYSGNGTRSSGYYSGTALLGPVGSGAGALGTHADPRSPGSPPGRPRNGSGGSGDSAALNGFLAPGVELTGLGGAVTFDSIVGLHVTPGPGFVPAAARRPSHSRRPDRNRPPVMHYPAGAPQRRDPGYVRLLHRHLLRRDVATLAGWPSDPGRNVLCLLTSPPPRFRSP